MSKSYDNCINLSDPVEESDKKLMKCITDPARKRREDPGNPDVCTIYSYHRLTTPDGTLKEIDRDCRTAAIGCVDCKKILIKNINEELAPFRERRKNISSKEVAEVLIEGNQKARQVAKQSLLEANAAMGLVGK